METILFTSRTALFVGIAVCRPGQAELQVVLPAVGSVQGGGPSVPESALSRGNKRLEEAQRL